MKTKLTLVSIVFHGRTLSVFVQAPIIEGKAKVTPKLLQIMQNTLGVGRGDTCRLG